MRQGVEHRTAEAAVVPNVFLQLAVTVNMSNGLLVADSVDIFLCLCCLLHLLVTGASQLGNLRLDFCTLFRRELLDERCTIAIHLRDTTQHQWLAIHRQHVAQVLNASLVNRRRSIVTDALCSLERVCLHTLPGIGQTAGVGDGTLQVLNVRVQCLCREDTQRLLQIAVLDGAEHWVPFLLFPFAVQVTATIKRCACPLR